MFQRSNARRRIAQVALAAALVTPAVGVTGASAFARSAVAAPSAEETQTAAVANAALSGLRGLDGQLVTTASFLQQATDFAQVSGVPGLDPWAAASVTPYVAQLGRLSAYVGQRAGVNPEQLLAVWVKTDSRRMVAVLTALAQLGTPYRARGAAPGGFDCSGLFSYAWQQAGITVPRSSGSIIKAAHKVSVAQLQPGDVVWRSGHVQMYLGLGDATVHSPRRGKTVEVAHWGRVSRFGSFL